MFGLKNILRKIYKYFSMVTIMIENKIYKYFSMVTIMIENKIMVIKKIVVMV